jgi:hypothetical protein
MIKALSLWQPWASLVAFRAKRIETRSWGTPYRGDVLICASASMNEEARESCFDDHIEAVLEAHGIDPFDAPKALPRGCVVAVARLAECRQITRHEKDWSGRMLTFVPRHAEELTNGVQISAEEFAFGYYAPDRFAWFLENIRPLPEPIPTRGAQGLWVPSRELADQVESALRGDTDDLSCLRGDWKKAANV